MSGAPDPARGRFVTILAARLFGLGIALLGFAGIAGKLALGERAGIALFLIGLVAALYVPILLTRRWRSPRP